MHLDIYYGFTLLLIFLTLVFGTISFKKYVAFYSQFPNALFLPIVLRWMVMSRIKKNPGAAKSLIELLHETCRKLQKEGICVLWLHKPFVVICSEETMKVFNNEQCALNKFPEYKLFKEGVGVSLLTADADVWRIRRRILNPAFKLPVLKHHVPMVNKNAITLVNKLMTEPEKTPVHILRLVQFCAFENIYDFFSSNIANDREREFDVENVIDMLDIVGKMITYRFFRPWLHPNITMKFFSKGRNYVKSLSETQKLSENMLLEMKDSLFSMKEKDLENDGSYDTPKSFAQIFVQHHIKNPEFTFKDMHDEINGLMYGGYETVSHALMWALFLLGHHEEVQEKLFNELDGFMANELTFDDFQHLSYLDCVIKETLRFYPPVPVYGKSLEKEVRYKQYTFPKGTDLLFGVYLIHRDLKSYSNPEKFYPERFLEKNSDKKPTTYAFAEGLRSCIGKQYAMMEMKIILAHMIKNFKITSLDRKEDVRLHWEVVLSTTEPLYFKISRRLQMQIH